ncbi:MAG TPA: hypothetical protein VGO56_21430 [Pyrinomonadaceae bacterium]|jgi:hypothetical protein|nr:hypothetical protein [Pyrinomonadaceae bacterium]
MRNTPKNNYEKLQQITNAWETLASTKTFGGMTLTQFKADTAASTTTREQLEDLDDQRTQILAARDGADAIALSKSQLVVNSVLGDPTEGPDSALIEAMGYTRKSDRKSGLTRKGNKPPAAP